MGKRRRKHKQRNKYKEKKKKAKTALSKGRKQTTFWQDNLWKNCHTGNVLLSDKPIRLYGGGCTRGLQIYKNSIMIDLGNVIDFTPVEFHGLEPTQSLKNSVNDYSLIRIEWADGSVPSLPMLFWDELAEMLIEQNRPVVCCCVGGHGRTGTALAILAHKFGITGERCPVQWVRLNYCDEAVESLSQIEYIEDMTGQIVMAKPSWHPTFTQQRKVWHGHGSGTSQSYVQDYLDSELPKSPYEKDQDPADIGPKEKVLVNPYYCVACSIWHDQNEYPFKDCGEGVNNRADLFKDDSDGQGYTYPKLQDKLKHGLD